MRNKISKDLFDFSTENLTWASLPYLAPSDFWFFDYIKQRLDHHPNAESLASQIVEIVETIPYQEYIKTFNKWLERMRLCVENKGGYFEHL